MNSIEKNEFTFESVLASRLKVSIENQDNQPLDIKDASVKGYVHELIARFAEKGNYYLAYGNEQANIPVYDIVNTMNNIPISLISLSLGNEVSIPKKATDKISPLFENKIWLWAVMGIIIIVLGGFTLKMMSKK